MSIRAVFAIALCNLASLRASKVGVALFGLDLGLDGGSRLSRSGQKSRTPELR